MKRLTVFCFALMYFVLSVLAVLNFEYEQRERIESDKQEIKIEKPDDMENEYFLHSLEQIMKDAGYDIMIKHVEYNDSREEDLYYMTFNTDDFINLRNEKNSMKINSNECISTRDYSNFNSYKLYIANKIADVSFFNFSVAEEYNLENCRFFVKRNQCEEIMNILMSCGYSTVADNAEIISGKYNFWIFSSIPLLLYIVSMSFYGFSNGKKHVLKKMDGYRCQDILSDEIKKSMPGFIITLGGISVCAVLAGIIIYPFAIKEYILFLFKYFLAGIVCLAIGYSVLNITIAIHNKAVHIKGKAPKKGIYIIAVMLKICFVMFLLFFLTIATRNVKLAFNTYHASESLSSKTEGYITVPVYNTNQGIDDLKENYLQFYYETAERYDGIIMDSRNYELDIENETMAEVFGQNEVKINENYLDFNPIYDCSGMQISRTMMSQARDVLNVIFPVSQKDMLDDISERIQNTYEAKLNIIFYDDENSKVFSYSSSALRAPDGKIKSPVILVANNEVLINSKYIYSYLSRGHYFFKPETDDPYTELYPLLSRLGIDGTTLNFEYVSDTYRQAVADWLAMLKVYAIQSVLLIFGFLAVVVFTAKLYCENYKNKISTYLIEGSSLFYCISKHIIIAVVSFVFCYVLGEYVIDISKYLNYSLLFVMAVIEIIIVFWASRRYTKSNLSEIIKGAD